MKECIQCVTIKPLGEFSRSKNQKDGLHPYCKTCASIRWTRWRLKNTVKLAQDRRLQKESLYNWYLSLKSGPCTDCNKILIPEVMEWDHLPEYTKSIMLSEAVKRRWARTSILKEIAKCELVCPNCHRYRTWSRNPNRIML